MSYPADPGGNFASDVHRRVLAHLPVPGESAVSLDDLVVRLNADAVLEVGHDETGEVLKDLEADGDATQSKSGWKQTKAGHSALTGPIADDGGRRHGE